jgi:flagellar protein FliS
MTDARTAYLGGMVTTASPARLLVMLYERLELDIERAADLQEREDFSAASQQLMHAQEIVLELQTSLRLDVWDGARQLSAIYAFLHSELVRANVRRDVAVTHSCLTIVRPLAEAWRGAALAAAAVA